MTGKSGGLPTVAVVVVAVVAVVAVAVVVVAVVLVVAVGAALWGCVCGSGFAGAHAIMLAQRMNADLISAP